MKKIYTLTTTVLNGTVTMFTYVDTFSSKELAEQTLEKMKEKNKGNMKDIFDISYKIEESTMYENEQEVPILTNDDSDSDRW